jgi:LysM repeat protein
LLILVAVSLAALSPVLSSTPAAAASSQLREPRLSIASPAPGSLVGGLIQVTAAFDAGRFGKVTALELWVDDLFYANVPLDTALARGSYSVDLDTQRLRNGQHTLRIRSLSGRKVAAFDEAVVTVSNGGVDIVPPMVSFYAPLAGETVSGTTTIGVNATDNDAVALVSIAVNRQPVLLKSNPPYTYSLDTTTLPLQDGKGLVTIEAMAIDRANNVGKAKPIQFFVNNPANATPMQKDPPEPVPTRPAAPKPAPAVTTPAPTRMALGPKPLPAASTMPKATATATARPPVRPLLPPRTTARLPRPQAADLSAAPVAPSATSMTAGARLTPPKGRPAEDGRFNTALSALAAPLSGVSRQRAESRAPRAPSTLSPKRPAGSSQPILMARAITPIAGEPERTAAPSASPAAKAPRTAPAASSTSTTLAGSRPATPIGAARVTAPPVATPTTSGTRMAILPRPAAGTAGRGGAPEMAPGRVSLPVYVARPVADTPARSRSYQVKSGDRLPEIARRFGVTPKSILVANGLADGKSLRPGRKLMIPGTFDIVVDNRRIEFDVNPRIEQGLPIAPFRQIFEQTGGVVVYYPGEQSVKAARPDKEVRLRIGSKEALVNGAIVLMEREASLDNGRTMVPVRFVTEALDMVAEYDVKSGNIYLIRK